MGIGLMDDQAIAGHVQLLGLTVSEWEGNT